jgi:hypothetical protein
MLSAGRSKPVARRRDERRNRAVVLDLIGAPRPAGSPRFLAIPNGSFPCLKSSRALVF